MAVIKSYIDAVVSGMNIHMNPPTNPIAGDVYHDAQTFKTYTWTGSSWVELSSMQMPMQPQYLPPTEEQLEKHPALKQAWEEYLVIKKILGV